MTMIMKSGSDGSDRSDRSVGFPRPSSLGPAIAALIIAMATTTANAATVGELAAAINGHAHGGNGTLLASVTDTDVVTVTGSVSGATATLSLDINAGVKVVWKAVFSGNAGYALVSLSGSGTFAVDGGTILHDGAGYAVSSTVENLTVGGDGALVKSVGDHAIWFNYSTVTVTGGTVEAIGASRRAIFANNASSSVIVTGGTVTASGGGDAILAYGSVAIGGDAHIAYTGASNAGNAINMMGDTATLAISGGTVSVIYGSAIYLGGVNKTVRITGGQVKKTGGGAGSGTAINIQAANCVAFNCGGTLATSDGNPLVNINPSYANTSLFIEKTGSAVAYIQGDTADLATTPADAAACWDIEGGISGVTYASRDGTHTGFLPAAGISVTPSGTIPITHDILYPDWLTAKGYGSDPSHYRQWLIDPTEEYADLLITNITVSAGGAVTLLWRPDLNALNLGTLRLYTPLGKTNLTDAADWGATNTSHRFFKLTVEDNK